MQNKAGFYALFLLMEFSFKKYTPMPAKAIKLPYKAYQPVDTKRNIHTATERIMGIGNSHILKGRFSLPNRRLNKTTPTACPMN